MLDTSAVLDLLRERSGVVKIAQRYGRSLLSFATWGELIAGVQKSNHPAKELTRLKAKFTLGQIVGADKETASIYGELLADLEKRGRRIPVNDIWIAATAVQLDLPLIACDGHFGRVTQLRWVAY